MISIIQALAAGFYDAIGLQEHCKITLKTDLNSYNIWKHRLSSLKQENFCSL
jgi:hypothetical protein